MSKSSNKLEALIKCESQLKPDPRVKFKIKRRGRLIEKLRYIH